MMKLGRFISLIGIFALVLVATAAWTQPGMGPGGGQGRGWGASDTPAARPAQNGVGKWKLPDWDSILKPGWKCFIIWLSCCWVYSSYALSYIGR